MEFLCFLVNLPVVCVCVVSYYVGELFVEVECFLFVSGCGVPSEGDGSVV